MGFVKVCAGLLLAAALPLSVQAVEQAAPRGPAMMGQGMPPQGMSPQGMGPQSQGMGPGAGMMAPPTPRPFAGVQFTEEQRKQIQQMMEKERTAHQQRVEKMQAVQEQLQQLYMADLWDAGAITKLYEKMHAEQRKTIAAMAEARNKVYALMTKEQRAQMKQYQQEQMQHFAAPQQSRPMPQQ
jgi:Spy/CpxP family protein refolding chaperone